MATKIDPSAIRTDKNTQTRLGLCAETVKEYADAMLAGDVFPPIVVFFDETKNLLILADGFHRLAAHKLARPNELILVDQRLGTDGNARWYSCGANREHGLRPSSEDKRFSVKQSLTTDEGANSSDREIARHVGVHHVTVGTIRRELEASGEIHQIDSRTVRRGGQTYVQNTAGINANRNETEPEKLTIGVNTSRINFGGKIVPEGAACVTCRFFEDGKCLTDEIDDPVPCIDVCGEYEVRVEEACREEIAPPDYKNAEPLGKKLKQTKQQRLYQNRDLQNCISVLLPSNNAEVFAIELREHWDKSYLEECIKALKHILDEDD